MATRYLIGVGSTAAKLTVGGTDITTQCRAITINQEYDDNDATGFNATSHQHVPGLTDDSIELELYQSFDASSTDATIYTVLGSQTGTTVIYQTNGSTVTATNPKYTLVGSPYSYQPVDGAVGDLAITKVKFMPVPGSAGVVRATS